MLKNRVSWFGVAAMLVGWPAAAQVSLTVDSPLVIDPVIVRDFNGVGDSNVSFARPPVQVVSGGVSEFTYTNAVSDPLIVWNDGAGKYDHAAYPFARVRYQQSTTARGNGEIWENPAVGGQSSNLLATTNYLEFHGNIPNPSPNGTGFRIDPFPNGQSGDVFRVDYIMMDAVNTLGLGEWDRAGDFNGWTAGNGTNVSVSGGAISGQASPANSDLQLNNALLIDANTYKYVNLRMRTTLTGSSNYSQFFWGSNGVFSEANSVRFGETNSEWHEYLFDMSAEVDWTGTSMRVRLDPFQTLGQTFEVDYFRVMAAIPEPSSVALLLAGAGVLGLVGRRRRSR